MDKTPKPTPNYSASEIEALVENYELLRCISRVPWLVRKCDLDHAVRMLPPKQYQAVLLVGLIGLDLRSAGTEMGVSHQTMWKRYRSGLEWITNYLNGGLPQGLHQGGRRV